MYNIKYLFIATALMLFSFNSFAQEKKERVKKEIVDDMYGKSQEGIKNKQDEKIDIPLKDGKVVYSEIIDVNLSKDELFNNCKNWFAIYFRSANDVIQLEDKEQGKIIGKALLKPEFSTFLTGERESDLRLSIQVDCKDNKYRYIITVIEYNHSHSSQTIPELIQIVNGEKKTLTNNKSYARKQLKSISDSIEELIRSLRISMKAEDDF